MAGNIQNVSFSPMTAVAPDLQVQQAQIQRQQALAQQLREMSMQDSPSNGGAVSWTQGLARVAQALRASKLQKSADARQTDLGRQQGAVLRSMFGMGSPATGASAADAPASDPPAPGGNTPSYANPLAAGVASAASQPIAPGGSPSFGTDMGNTLSSLTPEDGSAPPPPPSQTPASSPAPAPAAVSSSSAAGNSPGPWSLTGSPAQDFSMYAMNPDEYGKAVIAAHAPVDMAKTMQQARAALDRGDMATAQALLANVEKQNYIAPVSVRAGGVALDPHTGKPMFQAVQAPEGSNVNYGPDGKAASITPIQGAGQAIQAAAAAKSFGSKAGELVQVYNPGTGQMEWRPQQAVLQGGAGGGIAAGAPLGAQAAANVTGTNSANEFKTISDGAADVPNRKYALSQMAAIVADPKSVLGPGSEAWNHTIGKLATLTGTDAPATSKYDEFSKWANQYSARSAQELGLSGSDARVQIAIHATPNGEMTKPALAAIIPQMVGLENAKQGQANAAVAWQRTHGAADVQAFRTQWNQVYDPRIYTAMAQGPAAVQHLMKTVSASDRQALIRKSQALAAMGALPSGR